MKLKEIVQYCNTLLESESFEDYAPNGLQVEGRSDVLKIVTGVSACQSLIDQAVLLKADLILVHHGLFWKKEPLVITGMKQKRLKALLENDISLMAYHLPLDEHSELGNNALLGQLWGIDDRTPVAKSLVRYGVLTQPVSIECLIETVSNTLNRTPLHLPGGPEMVQNIAWCSGGAQDYIDKAIQWQADVFISGEVSEPTTHQALENGLHYISAGHYATERLGVKALGEHLAEVFGVEVVFVDVENPV